MRFTPTTPPARKRRSAPSCNNKAHKNYYAPVHITFAMGSPQRGLCSQLACRQWLRAELSGFLRHPEAPLRALRFLQHVPLQIF